jgi:hypothetical protein
MSAQILTAAEVDKEKLAQFLASMYSPAKSAFLRDHGTWWHGGDKNRWVLLLEETIAGYCAVIPTCVWLRGAQTPALWWVDLVIDPQFRGHGYQTLFDDRIRSIADLKLGFPNELAAKIHRKHHWGVREDLQVRMLPLQPTQIHAIQGAQGFRGRVMRLAARMGTPVFAGIRMRLASYQPKTARRIDTLDPQALAKIFKRFISPQLNTTYRDATYFEWRYVRAPYREELSYYLAGPEASPTHYLVARHLQKNGKRVSRILDLFGNFDDRAALVDIIKLAVKDAAANRSVQMTMMITLPALQATANAAGFILSTQARFCWQSLSFTGMNALQGMNYWILGDSDNDNPV